MNWLWNFVRPWRFKYWLVCDHDLAMLMIHRARFNPAFGNPCWYLVDGPFNTTDEAARKLTFFGNLMFGDWECEHEPWEDDE